MRYVRIFLVCTQEVLAERSEQVVWLLLSCINPLLMMLFWRGSSSLHGWTKSLLLSYYILVIVAGALLMSHTEENVGIRDIQEGNLSMYIVKPFSYFWIKFFNNSAYRILQGGFSIIILCAILFFFPSLLQISHQPFVLILSICIAINALMLIFAFKIIIGILAFWLIEIRGLFEIVEVLLAIFAGYVMPVALFPDWLAKISYLLPFSYMIYFPVTAILGKLSIPELIKVLGMQSLWLIIFYFLYQKLWNAGLRKYSAVGQ